MHGCNLLVLNEHSSVDVPYTNEVFILRNGSKKASTSCRAPGNLDELVVGRSTGSSKLHDGLFENAHIPELDDGLFAESGQTMFSMRIDAHAVDGLCGVSSNGVNRF